MSDRRRPNDTACVYNVCMARVNVYLPDGFRRNGDERYPVLYLLHGQGDAYDSWANPDNGDLLNTAAGFPGIIVMPEGDRGFYANWWNGGRRGRWRSR